MRLNVAFMRLKRQKQKCGVRTLQRQYNSSLYERLTLSRNKEGVLRLATEGMLLQSQKIS